GSFDCDTGLVVFPLPDTVPPLTRGTTRTRMIGSDFQEAMNIDTLGPNIMLNTRTATVWLRVVAGPAVDWLTPARPACVTMLQRLVVAASAPGRVASVRFRVDGKLVAVVREGDQGVWSATVGFRRGTHLVVATAV